MTEDSDNKTQRFVDALDDTVPRLLPGKKNDFPAPETSATGKSRGVEPGPTLTRFLHLMAALLTITVVPSEIVEPILGHLNGKAPITNVQLAGVAVKLGLVAVFLWSWIQFTRRNKDCV